jgi:hypothetical protein
MRIIKDGVAYDEVTKDAAFLAKYLDDLATRLGNPEGFDTETAWILIDEVVKCWGVCFPEERAAHIYDLEEDINHERSVHDAVKADGGYFSLVIPPNLFSLLKTMIPRLDLTDKKFQKKWVVIILYERITSRVVIFQLIQRLFMAI